jgi:DNA-binding NtrC family response regulator
MAAKILLVDDESGVVTVLRTFLETWWGYDVLSTTDGEEAVSLLKSGKKIDLLISDIRMMPIDGMQLLKLARKVRPSMPVVMITAYSSETLMEEAKELGAFDFLPKPFRPEVLLSTVERAISGQEFSV